MTTGGLRIQANNRKDGDIVQNGMVTVNSGLKVGASGFAIPSIQVVSQVIDFAAIGSGNSEFLQFAYTSGVVGTLGSGDYFLPLNQPAESGYLLLSAQSNTGDSIAVTVFATENVNPAAAAFRFLVLHSLGL